MTNVHICLYLHEEKSEKILKKWYMWFLVGGQQAKYGINRGKHHTFILVSFFVFYQNENIACKKKEFSLFKIKVFNLKFQYLKIK